MSSTNRPEPKKKRRAVFSAAFVSSTYSLNLPTIKRTNPARKLIALTPPMKSDPSLIAVKTYNMTPPPSTNSPPMSFSQNAAALPGA